MTVVVHGLRELDAALRQAGKEAVSGLRTAEREAADPIRRSGEQLAQAKIRNIGDRWWRLTTGVSATRVYVVPREKGVRGKGPKVRRKFGRLFMERALDPALRQHEPEVHRRFERLLDRVCKGV